MRWWRIVLAVAIVAALTSPLAAQSGPQVAITMTVAGTIQDHGGAYYIAFSVSNSLLAGPQPDSTNWTHYVVYRDGRFFFGVVPPTAIQPFSFTTIRPPVPFLYGQVQPDRRSLRVSVPLTSLQVGPSLPTRLMVNFVTVDDTNRPLDALGRGVGDRLGFVTLDLRRDLYVVIPAPRENAHPDPNFAIQGGEIHIGTP
jgi:hypothetical protein